jgi:serine/threonine protein phosphatase PrpC
VRVVELSDVGCRRQMNEDCAFVDAGNGLLVLADGMGGHAAGEIASDLAVKTIVAHMANVFSQLSGGAESDSIMGSLTAAVSEASRQIHKRAAEDANLKGMGTTVVVAFCRERNAYLAHVGDSRAYLFQRGSLRQMTQDHSLMAEMIASGEISEKEARSHRLRSMLTRSLGNEFEVRADVQQFAWDAGDCLLLCSDGLTNMVDDAKIEKILRRHGKDLQRSCTELVKAANSYGGIDNITVILACPE